MAVLVWGKVLPLLPPRWHQLFPGAAVTDDHQPGGREHTASSYSGRPEV